MKKAIAIVVLGLMVTFNAEAVSYVFKDNLYAGPDIVTKEDPTTFQNIVFVKEKKIEWWDKRKAKDCKGLSSCIGWKKSIFKQSFKIA